MSATGTYRTPNRGHARGSIPFATSDSPSGIPRPATTAATTSAPMGLSVEASNSTLSASRQKQSKRDEAIRKKMEADLNKKRHYTPRPRHSRKAPPGTVLALKPSQALQIKPATTVAEAARLMAAKREDCVLVTDDDDRIAGIFTAKDLAFRVVGTGRKALEVSVESIMTRNPLCARTNTSATEALDLMVQRGFRHLPVMDENQDISGVLDITKCFYEAMEKLERAYSSSRKLYDALEGVQSELGASQPQQIIQYVEALRQKMSGPTLESVLNGQPPITVSVRTSVKDAAALMRENHTTAVLVQDQGSITGIFTSKDVVLRVIAVGLDPANCSVVRVMTPHPDFAPADMSIQSALRKMHDGHYLNLPVMNEAGEIVGMVDVLKLTYATLEQINTMATNESEGPAWNKFWLSMDHESESMVSGTDPSSRHVTPGRSQSLISPDISRAAGDSVLPNDSASHNGGEESISEILPLEDKPFPFKFKAPSGRTHRVRVAASAGLGSLVASVTAKLGNEIESVGGAARIEEGQITRGFALAYLDNEGDTVSITTDRDLMDAIILARQNNMDKVDLFVHDPSQPAISEKLYPNLAPAAAASSSINALRLQKREKMFNADDEDDGDVTEQEGEMMEYKHHGRNNTKLSGQLIGGVPNELILPGAIAGLAVVIAGVFTIGRLAGSR